MAISGLMGIAVSLLAGPLANWLTTTFISGRTMAGMSPLIIETGSSLAVQVIRSLFKPVLYYSLAATGVGLGIIIISAVIKAPGKKAAEAEAEVEEAETVAVETEAEETESEEPESGEIKFEGPEAEETVAAEDTPENPDPEVIE